MRFTLFLFLLIFSFFTSAQIQSPCEVGKDRYICSDHLILETKSTLPGKWRFKGISSGTFSDPSNFKTTLSSIVEPIVKVYWVNNDQSCADTLEIILPKIGSTSLIKNGKPINENELKLCYGDSWKANTTVTQGKSFVAYALYKVKPPLVPNIYKDAEAFPGPVLFVNNDLNDGSFKNKYPNNSNEYWFVPILYNEISVGGPLIDSDCQITGTPFKITYLDPIHIIKKEDCMLGKSEVTITGGASNYSVLDFQPKTLGVDSNKIKMGEIHFSNILVKQQYSIDVKDEVGCKANFITKFSPCPACKTDIIYQKTYCIYDNLPKPVLKEGAGIGLLELVPSTEKNLVFDSLTGAIDISLSKPGKYIIRNKSSLSCTKQVYTDFNIEILDSIPLPIGNAVDTICATNPKIGDIKTISAQLITWYNKLGQKLDPAIDPAIHGNTYYCTQSIKGCESEKKSVKVFAPTISPPIVDTILYLCNKVSDFSKNVLIPQNQSIIWRDAIGKKINSEDMVGVGLYYVTQFLGCESKNNVKVKVNQKNIPIPNEVNDSLFYCKDQIPKIQNITSLAKNTFVFDLPNSTTFLPKEFLLEQGLYYVVRKDSISNCLSERKKVWVNIPSFDMYINITEPFCGYNNGKIEIDAKVHGYTYFLNSKKSDNKISAINSGDYTLKIIENSKLNCVFDTILSVSCRKFDFQEILTPNLDGYNDFLVVGLTEAYPLTRLVIYNRWGNQVFESSIPYSDNWDGKDQSGNPLPSGTYYYVIEKDKTTILKTGFIELIQ